MFIVFEGPDGSGKTTQARKLVNRLRASHLEVLHLTFPSSTPAGYAARKAIKTPWREVSDDPMFQAIVVQSLMAADMYSVVDRIRFALSRGVTIVADRWWPSTLVYGGVEKLDPIWLSEMISSLPEADLNILLTLDTSCAADRMKMRGIDCDKYESVTFQSGVHTKYYQMWNGNAKRDGKKWVCINAAGLQDEIHAAIWNVIVAARAA